MKRFVVGSRWWTPVAAVLALGSLVGCDSSSSGDRAQVEVHIGSDPLVLDARELLTARGDFSLTAEAQGGTIEVTGELVTFTPDAQLGYGEVVLTGSAPDGDSVQAVVDIYYAPDSFRFGGVINDLEPEPYAELMTQYSGATIGDRFGDRMFEAGDWNGDGYGDIVVTASRANRPLIDQGAIYLLEGGPDGLTGPFLALEGTVSGEMMGSAARGGDLDGDGRTDLVYLTQPSEGTITYSIVWGGSEEDISKQEIELPDQLLQFVADLDGDGRAEIGVRQTVTSDDWVVYRGTRREDVASEVAFTVDGCQSGARVEVLGDVDPDHEGVELAFRCDGKTRVVGATGDVIATYAGELQPVQSLGDLDGDGIPEFVVVPPDGGSAYVQLGGLGAIEGSGCDETRRVLPSGAAILTPSKDIDHDGILDLVYSRGATFSNTGWETGLWLSSSADCPDPVGPDGPPGAPRYPTFASGIRGALSLDIDGDSEEELVLAVLGGPGHVVVFDMP